MFEKIKQTLKSLNFIYTLIFTLIAVLLLCAVLPLCLKGVFSPAGAVAIYAAAYILLAALTALVLNKSGFSSKIGVDPNSGMLVGNITLDILVKLFLPTVISDNAGRIVWYNKAFSSKVGSSLSLYGKKIDSYTDISFERILQGGSEGTELSAFGAAYSVRSYRMTSHNKIYIFTVWDDRTELVNAYKKIDDEDVVFSYIVIDNLDEIIKYVQDKSRTAVGDVYDVLKAWADSVGGFIKEYEREKYVFLFSSKYLKGFEESRFDILDKIREIRIGSASIPITVSVGMSRLGSSLSEKESAAQAALDMALQRGGDQVVIKTESGMDFYGGRTKTVQKRAKVHARVIADELVMNISQSSNVLIMGHRNSDFDALGACVGMARLAMFCGVKVNIIANVKEPGLEKCFNKFHAMPEYRDMFINSFEAQDMLSAETFLIIVDVNNPEQFEAPDVADNVKNIAIIDHHRRTAEFDYPLTISHIEPPASSACELVAEILEQALPQGYLAKEEADMMYAGIMLDTKQFTRNVGNRTFGAALYLKNEGASPIDTQSFFKAGIDDFVRETKFESNVSIYKKMVAIAQADSEDGSDSDRIAAAKAADRLLTLDGISASFVLCCFDRSIHISARSSGSINVQLILEKLNGGGHFDSAAARISDRSADEVMTLLKSAIDEYLDSI